MENDPRKTRILKATRLLQAKVGSGPEIEEKLVKKSQRLIDANNIDFVPMARDYLSQLEHSIAEARAPNSDKNQILQDMINPVMQLKANAGMFNYQLVSKLAGVMLSFLETVEKIDRDVIDIVEVHHKTLIVLIGNQMSGDGGDYGEQLTRELKDACKRYFAKQASGGDRAEDQDAFFVDG